MAASLHHLFDRLPGAWSVARTIADERIGAGRFEGQALFRPQTETSLLYKETGELVIGAWRGPAYRQWLYVSSSAALSIFYPDGKTLLHRFELGAGESAEHTHLCGEDRYAAQLSSTGESGFALSYRVDGPSKRYALHTAYTR
ncbi:MAG TPA: DUF6314 family protein [Vitreimonas sp.]|jgi:hypothetical protein|nr:DUF6314 family protein [Vitreimonas sp.]